MRKFFPLWIVFFVPHKSCGSNLHLVFQTLKSITSVSTQLTGERIFESCAKILPTTYNAKPWQIHILLLSLTVFNQTAKGQKTDSIFSPYYLIIIIGISLLRHLIFYCNPLTLFNNIKTEFSFIQIITYFLLSQLKLVKLLFSRRGVCLPANI